MQRHHLGRIPLMVVLRSILGLQTGSVSANSILPSSAMSAPIVVQTWQNPNSFMQTQSQNNGQRSSTPTQSDDAAAADDGEFHPLLDPLDAAEQRRKNRVTNTGSH